MVKNCILFYFFGAIISQIVFCVLKFCGVIEWRWLHVFIPSICLLAAAVLVILFVAFAVFVINAENKKEEKEKQMQEE